jgi:hypothetical protein
MVGALIKNEYFSIINQTIMEQNEQLFSFPVETSTQRSLLSAGSWAFFLSILGFVFLGLILIVLIVAGAGMMNAFKTLTSIDSTAAAGLAMLIIFLVFAVIAFLSLLLFRGANLVKRGIYSNDQAVFNAGLASYRTYFIVYGILSILSLLFTAVDLFIN